MNLDCICTRSLKPDAMSSVIRLPECEDFGTSCRPSEHHFRGDSAGLADGERRHDVRISDRLETVRSLPRDDGDKRLTAGHALGKYLYCFRRETERSEILGRDNARRHDDVVVGRVEMRLI